MNIYSCYIRKSGITWCTTSSLSDYKAMRYSYEFRIPKFVHTVCTSIATHRYIKKGN